MKRKFWLVLSGALLTFFCHIALANLEQMIKNSGTQAETGVVVKDLTTGKILYQHDPNRLFVPASSLKMYSGAAALIMLGPDFHFDTGVYTDASTIHAGMLQGNVYVKFSGDPSLTSADLMSLMQVLKKQSVTRIQGNVILVPPPYTPEPYAPGTLAKDRMHPYGAPITPIIIDQNAIFFSIQTTKPGQRANVSVAGPSNRIVLINELYTKRPGMHCGLSYSWDAMHRLVVRGCVAPSRSPYVEHIALADAMNYGLGVIEKALSFWQIGVGGHVITGQLPSSVKLLDVHSSEPLPVLLADTLKPSNNVYASALYLKTGQAYWRKTATWENSGLAVKDILQKYASVQMQSATIVDGAGLSRDNRVTPMQAVELLSYMHSKFMLSDDFISALPVPGQKGTLIHRHIAPNALQKNIHAKTGYMKGIVVLSGYLPSANHHTLAFAIMTNSNSQKVYSTEVPLATWKFRELEDAICRYLMKANV